MSIPLVAGIVALFISLLGSTILVIACSNDIWLAEATVLWYAATSMSVAMIIATLSDWQRDAISCRNINAR